MNTLSLVSSANGFLVQEASSSGRLVSLVEFDRRENRNNTVDSTSISEWKHVLTLGACNSESFWDVVVPFAQLVAQQRATISETNLERDGIWRFVWSMDLHGESEELRAAHRVAVSSLCKEVEYVLLDPDVVCASIEGGIVFSEF